MRYCGIKKWIIFEFTVKISVAAQVTATTTCGPQSSNLVKRRLDDRAFIDILWNFMSNDSFWLKNRKNSKNFKTHDAMKQFYYITSTSIFSKRPPSIFLFFADLTSPEGLVSGCSVRFHWTFFFTAYPLRSLWVTYYFIFW